MKLSKVIAFWVVLLSASSVFAQLKAAYLSYGFQDIEGGNSKVTIARAERNAIPVDEQGTFLVMGVVQRIPARKDAAAVSDQLRKNRQPWMNIDIAEIEKIANLRDLDPFLITHDGSKRTYHPVEKIINDGLFHIAVVTVKLSDVERRELFAHKTGTLSKGASVIYSCLNGQNRAETYAGVIGRNDAYHENVKHPLTEAIFTQRITGHASCLALDEHNNLVGIPVVWSEERFKAAPFFRSRVLLFPADVVLKYANELAANGRIVRGRMKLQMQDVDRRKYPQGGVFISQAQGQNGLMVGDVITQIDGHVISDVNDSLYVTARSRPGEIVKTQAIRGNTAQIIDVVLSE